MSSKKSSGYRKKGGTHGSLSKAGKMRQTLKQQKTFREEGKGVDRKKYPHIKKHKCPRVARRKQFRRRIILNKKGNKMEDR